MMENRCVRNVLGKVKEEEMDERVKNPWQAFMPGGEPEPNLEREIMQLKQENAALKKRVEEYESWGAMMEDTVKHYKKERDDGWQREEQAEARYQRAMTDLAHAEHKLFKLREDVGEVLDGTLPYLAEKRLKAALNEK
jgi:predicted RNase H-like nuclease (RuvC/YqgF family)